MKKLNEWDSWMHLVAWLIIGNVSCMMGFFGALINIQPTTSRTSASIPNSLLSVPDDQVGACLAWAFGEDYEMLLQSACDNRWRMLHPDLTPIYGSTEIQKAFDLISREWLNKETETLTRKK